MQPHPSFMLLGGSAPFTVDASSTAPSASGTNGGTETTANVTANVTGPGAFTYTYAWARVSGSTLITANSPTAATTKFHGVAPNNSTISAVFQCTVTRSDGFQAQLTTPVTVTLTAAAAPPPSLNAGLGPSDSGARTLGGGTNYSESYTASGSGGTGPYTYTWSAFGPGASVTSGSGTSTTLNIAGQAAGNSSTCGVTVTVHDSVGATETEGDSYNITWV